MFLEINKQELRNHMFSKILIANRGEIALRVIRACKELGVKTVAVYSQADKDASYLDFADEKVCIGPKESIDSYLNITRIISAAEVTNVEAIHPGYGFLAENAHFAEVCRDCKIKFIGPNPETITSLGDKVEARKLAMSAKVPVVPGTEDPVDTEDEAATFAAEVGYPVIIKAAAGGGGRGIRIVHNEVTLRSAFHAAKTEAELAFNNGDLFIEKYLERARHVEVQVLADHHGHAIHLFERDCSLQRRFQKVIEETPSPHVSKELRDKICKCAVRIIKTAKYVNAGTVEFLVGQDNQFYFGEVNTRIQVEHPITEMVTGVDLVQWQLRIASGEKLTLQQKDIQQNGHAIECRINAEDPTNNFCPSPGPINLFQAPGGLGVRLDTHVSSGAVVSPYYDSMIGKLIVHKPTREEAFSCMKRALNEFKIGPIKTTIGMHLDLLSHPQFIKGDVDTAFIERNRDS